MMPAKGDIIMAAGGSSYPDTWTPGKVVNVMPPRHGLSPSCFHAVLLGDDALDEPVGPMVFHVGGAGTWRPATEGELFDLLGKAFVDHDTLVNMEPRAFCCPLGGELMRDPVMLESVRLPPSFCISAAC